MDNCLAPRAALDDRHDLDDDRPGDRPEPDQEPDARAPIVWTTLGGSQVRVKLTNRFSRRRLVVAGAHVALRQSGGTITAGSDRTLTFGGNAAVTIPAGAEAWSDPVTLTVPQHADLAVSTYLSGTFTPKTFHPTGLKTSYLSRTGNFASSSTMPAPTGFRPRRRPRCSSWPRSRCSRAGTPRDDRRARRLDHRRRVLEHERQRQLARPSLEAAARAADGTPVSVLNAGIGSNRFEASDGAGALRPASAARPARAARE